MFQAKSDDGSLITLMSLSMDKINALRRQNKFYCPNCHEPVIIKAGVQITPHFAHQSKTSCPSGKYGESAYHERAKVILGRWLTSQAIPVEREKYLPRISQRPDLFIKINNQEIAIEFQCTSIPIKAIQKRIYNYQKENIISIWILGANLLKNNKKLSVNQFILQFLHQFHDNHPTTLYFFCPHSLKFYIINDLYLTTMSRAYRRIHMRKLTHLTFNDLFRRRFYTSKQLISLWKGEKRRFRLQKRLISYGNELNWRHWLYKKGIYIDQLPALVHLPIRSQFMMKVPTWNWQSRLCLDLIKPLRTGEYFTLSQCKQLLKKYIYDHKHFPLILSHLFPINEYLSHLESLGVIERRNPTTFRKINSFSLNKNIEEALKWDNLLLNQLMYNYSKI